jgi:hypothetical protein
LHRAAGSTIADEVALDLVWPIEVFSLSHVALPTYMEARVVAFLEKMNPIELL